MLEKADSATKQTGPADIPICPQCGESINLSAPPAGRRIRCGHCHVLLEPDPAKGIRVVEYAERKNRLATAAGWSGSVILHAATMS